METWQVKQIRAHFSELIERTNCTVSLLSILQANNLLHSEEGEQIQAKATRFERAKELYEILSSRSSSYQVLIEALLETKQSGAAAILQKFPWDKIANLRINFLGKAYSVNELLDSEQIRKVYQWLQENLSAEESLKLNETVFKSECVLELVRNTIPEPDPLYVPRFLSRRLAINPALFLQDCRDIFVFKNIGRLALRPFVSSNGIHVSTDQILNKKISSRFILLKTDAHWEDIKTISASASIHLIKFEAETGEFVLEATSGGSEILNEYLQHRAREDTECLSEEQFVGMSLSENGKGFCICDTPGMGKSLLLENIARTFKSQNPDLIVAFTRLRELDLSSTESCFHKILAYISSDPLAFVLLQEITASTPTKFALFFDGLDEVHLDKLELAIKFLLKVIEAIPKATVFITSRPVVRKELEQVTKTIPYDILPFDETTQLHFLTSVWKRECTSGNLESFKEYARICLDKLKKSLTEKEREISGVPLLCKMIADVFANEAKAYADGVLSNEYLTSFGKFKNTLLEMYIKFVERQLGETSKKDGEKDRCNFECMNINFASNCSKSCKIRSFHAWSAIQLIFPNLAKKICENVNKFENLNKQEKLTPGLLQQISQADTFTLQFVHRTFAEFLVAEFFAKAIFLEISFWRQQKFETMVTSEIFATVNWSWNDKTVHCRLRENVVAYFLNAFITESCKNLQILNKASMSVTSEIFLRAAVGCLRSDFDGVLEILFGAASCHGTPIKHTEYELPDETVSCLEVAGQYCRASTIEKLKKFYLEQYDINLFEKFATYPQCINAFKSVLRRADYEVTQLFIDSIQLEGHGFLFDCLEHSYSDDDELVEKRLELAGLLLAKCPQLISEKRIYFFISQSVVHILAPKLHLKAIQFLVKNGADVLVKDIFNRTVFYEAAEYMSTIELQKTCELMFLGRTVGEMLAVFVNPKKIFWKGRGQGQSEQCRRHCKLVIGALHLASTGVSSVSPKDFTQVWTMAMDEKNNSHFSLLVDILRQPELRQKYDQTLTNLFQIAVGEGDVSVVRSLLDNNPFLLELKLDCSSVTIFITHSLCMDEKEFPVHVAVRYQQLKMFQFLDFMSADIFAVDSNGKNILHKAAGCMNCEQFHGVLETVGRHWEKVPTSGESLKASLCELFNWKEKLYSQTPLHFACRWMNLPLKTLDLYLACGNMAAPVESAPLFNINEANGEGKTPLMIALRLGKLDLAHRLLSRGASFSGRDRFGQTVAHICASQNLFEETKLALESGCDVNELDNDGNNVLQAGIGGILFNRGLSRELIQLLHDAGVDKMNKNKHGRTAYDTAAERPKWRSYSSDILQILKPE